MTANEVAALVTKATPYVTRAASAYGGAVLAKTRDKAADATVETGARILQRVFGRKRTGEALPEPLADVVAHPQDEDLKAVLKVIIRKALEQDAIMLGEVRAIVAEAPPPYLAHIAGRDAYWANRDINFYQAAPSRETATDRAADRLASAVQAEWNTQAKQRRLTGSVPIRLTWGEPSSPMAGPPSGAARNTWLPPLPRLAPANETQLASGEIEGLHALYGGLGSGRLIIAGGPGSGKTSAAVLLLLAALRHRDMVSAEERRQVPVPILLTLQGWDPRHQTLRDWLVGELQHMFTLFTGRDGAVTAAEILDHGRISVILDGLDEISPDLRPRVIRELSDQATFRLILLSRSGEMQAAAAHRGILQGAAAIELRPVDVASAADFLQQVQRYPWPPAWRELTERITDHPDSALSRALTSPLALTLIRDTYQQGDDVRELLDFCDRQPGDLSAPEGPDAIIDHLLDRVLPAAYDERPSEVVPCDAETSKLILTNIAIEMSLADTSDLNWWQIPQWTPAAPRRLSVGFAFGLMVGLATLAVVMAELGGDYGLIPRLVLGLGDGLTIGLIAGFAAWFGARKRSPEHPGVQGKFQSKKILNRKSFTLGLRKWFTLGRMPRFALWLFYVLVSGLSIWLMGGLADLTELAAGLAGVLILGLAVGIGVGIRNAFRADPDSSSSLSPTDSWHRSRRYDLVSNLVAGLVFGAVGGPLFGIVAGLKFGSMAGFIGGSVSGLLFGLLLILMLMLAHSVALHTWLASARLAKMWRAPVRGRMNQFLDEAYRRNVLRAVGPSYQFRHARLQYRLAGLRPRQS